MMANSVALAEPDGISNNAIALGQSKDGPTLYSFLGLEKGKTFTDVSRRAIACILATQICRDITQVPVPQGRLASIAVSLGDGILIFGGYSVGADGAEISTSEVLAFDPATESYSPRAAMPTPVDDSVAVVHQDRYVYLISGWHDDGNVALTQVYDAQEDRWFLATPYPGTPVFGHAGGYVDTHLIIADGVAVINQDTVTGQRSFALVDEAWHGVIDPLDPSRIDWQKLPAHPGVPAYRMAAIGNRNDKLVVFAGGSGNPYNFNGIGYNGAPSQPLSQVFGFDIRTQTWVRFPDKADATMDHRGMVHAYQKYWTFGGMIKDQQVDGRLRAFTPGIAAVPE